MKLLSFASSFVTKETFFIKVTTLKNGYEIKDVDGKLMYFTFNAVKDTSSLCDKPHLALRLGIN